MFLGTISEFADLVGVDYQTAAGLVRYLKEVGVAREVGTRPNKAGRGKPSTVYTFPNEVQLTFYAAVEETVAV